jgi:hypothetical protein
VTGIRVELHGAVALFTGRDGGVSTGPFRSLNLGLWTDDAREAVQENRGLVSDAAGGRALAQAHQVHGTEVVRWGDDDPEGALPKADGGVTARDDLAPIVLTADCLPIALAAPGAVGMVHAGWRGLADGVLENGLRALREVGGDGGAIHAAIGPGAGGCCYEVGDEVAARFPGWALRRRNLDLKAVAARRLADAGVADVVDVGRCTMCEPETFFSHRASGGLTGRQGGLVWLS